MEMYKILTGKENMDPTRLFQFASRDLNLRGHGLKLYEKQCRYRYLLGKTDLQTRNT